MKLNNKIEISIEKRYYFLILIFVLSLLQIQKASASHLQAADIYYKHKTGLKYDVYVDLYRDCSGIWLDHNDHRTLYVYSFLMDTLFELNMAVQAPAIVSNDSILNAENVSPLCASQMGNTTCDGGVLPGTFKVTYKKTVTLPFEASDWQFSWSRIGRNTSNNLNIGLDNNMYIIAELNNISKVNSSPSFTSVPIATLCPAVKFTYSFGTIDPDGDSLSYELVNPMSNYGLFSPYNAGYSVTNPLDGTLTFDSQTGTMEITPNTPVGFDHIFVLAVVVYEYRAGKIVGSSFADLQFRVSQTCVNTPPSEAGAGVYDETGVTRVNNNSLVGCSGETVGFKIQFSDLVNVTDQLSVTSNIAMAIPGATLSFTGVGTNVVDATFNWPTSSADVGFHSFILMLEDNGCPIIGSQTYEYNIEISDRTKTIDDQTVCSGGVNPVLTSTGGSVFTWSVLSGEAINIGANFTCNPCNAPSPTPSITTTYVVTSDLDAGACLNKDTIVVSPVPSFNLTMSADVEVCVNANTILSGIPPSNGDTYSYNWSPKVSLVNFDSVSTTVRPSVNTRYYIDVENENTGCIVRDSVNVTVSGFAPSVNAGEDTSLVCNDSETFSPLISGNACQAYSVEPIAFVDYVTAKAGRGSGDATKFTGGGDDSFGKAYADDFDFFCNDIAGFGSINIKHSANGFISLSSSALSSSYATNVALPSVNAPESIVAFAWADLDTIGSNNLKTKHFDNDGITLNQMVYYENFKFKGHPSSVIDNWITAYIILNESDGSIEMHFKTLLNPANIPVTIGIMNKDKTIAYTLPGYNNAWGGDMVEQAFKFTPLTTIGPFTYLWDNAATLNDEELLNATATPTVNTTYTLTVSDQNNILCEAKDIVNVNVNCTVSIDDLTSFEVKENNERALLKWSVLDVFSNGIFLLERSSDGFSFEEIGVVNHIGKRNYSFLDETPLSGRNYYRIKLNDIDEGISYSEVKFLDFETDLFVQVFPNPVNNDDVLNFIINSEIENISISIYSIYGEKVKNIQLMSNGDGIKYGLDINEFSSGTYFYKINSSTSGKFEIIK